MQLQKGVTVISNDGQRIGTLDRVITDPKNDSVTHLVISNGFLIKRRKLIPVYWLGDVFEDRVHLSVGSRLFGCLIEFHTEG